jgi:hypothetical protein
MRDYSYVGKTQKALLRALQILEREMKKRHEEKHGVPTTELAALVYGKGKTFTEAQRVSTSRTLNKLASQGKVIKIKHPIRTNESHWRLNPKAAKITPT